MVYKYPNITVGKKKWMYKKRKSKKTQTLTKKVKKLTKEVRANTQYNWLDRIASFNASTTAFTSDIFTLDNIAEGTGSDERQGNTITITSIQMRGTVKNSQGLTGDDFNNTRLILFICREDPASFTPGDLLANPTLYNSLYKKGGEQRWSKIKDWCFHTNLHRVRTVTTTSQYIPTRPETIHINYTHVFKKPLVVTYRGSVAIKNVIQLLAVSDSGVPASPEIQLNCRVNYRP